MRAETLRFQGKCEIDLLPRERRGRHVFNRGEKGRNKEGLKIKIKTRGKGNEMGSGNSQRVSSSAGRR